MKERDLQIEIMKAAGIGNIEITRLTFLRIEVASGDRSEITEEHKRMVFTKFLLETSQLSEDIPE